MKLFLKDCKLWWPAWQMGIPFTSYGYTKSVDGERYSFQVDKQLDAWLCPDGQLMPLESAKLCSLSRGVLTDWVSFSILRNGKVQVNSVYNNDWSSRSVDMYDINDLYFEGDAYFEDE